MARTDNQDDIARRTEENMAAAGVATSERVQDDYFGFDTTEKVSLPDGVSWIEFKILNEGDRARYLNAQNRKVTIRKGSGDAELEMAPGEDRKNLLSIAIVGWNLVRNGEPVRFTAGNLNQFLQLANPEIVDLIHKEVTLAHPWLLDDMTLEQVDQEIENLQAIRNKIQDREEG